MNCRPFEITFQGQSHQQFHHSITPKLQTEKSFSSNRLYVQSDWTMLDCPLIPVCILPSHQNFLHNRKELAKNLSLLLPIDCTKSDSDSPKNDDFEFRCPSAAGMPTDRPTQRYDTHFNGSLQLSRKPIKLRHRIRFTIQHRTGKEIPAVISVFYFGPVALQCLQRK